MTTRAAINILGSTGEVIDITSLGVETLSCSRLDIGRYRVMGTLGMAPPPEGWGYVVNQADSDKTVAITYADGELLVTVGKDGEPADLEHSVTLHVSVADLAPFEMPPIAIEPAAAPVDPVAVAITETARLRAVADYAIAPLQDALDIDEATDEDITLLKAWKKYRVALNRATDQPGYPTTIDWPSVPA
ncbi:tail fiber assembly protein [Pseudomonas sp. SJZ131]|uniref:tail fiber assembly protein n=1 Tax=Pseudomonas sp. SJZ131 TaxID=2572895 RepID=UPI0011995030|nr:tail fiber assembly protein [Pseudomonas sp. SJZ131]TWD52495.1 virus tail fiber assembly protein lambda gpK [Pseudomonas sp. SJZ131]